MKLPGEDPELKAQEARASADKIDAIRERMSARTMQSMRLFGSRWAMSGAKGVPLLQVGAPSAPTPQQAMVNAIRPRP